MPLDNTRCIVATNKQTNKQTLLLIVALLTAVAVCHLLFAEDRSKVAVLIFGIQETNFKLRALFYKTKRLVAICMKNTEQRV